MRNTERSGIFGGVRVGFPTGQALQQKILELMTVGHKKQKTKSLSAMHEGNALDISEVWPLNERQLPTRTSEGGRFSDERSFSPQTHLPLRWQKLWVRSRRFAVRCARHSFAV
jgi:hypothetical protein